MATSKSAVFKGVLLCAGLIVIAAVVYAAVLSARALSSRDVAAQSDASPFADALKTSDKIVVPTLNAEVRPEEKRSGFVGMLRSVFDTALTTDHGTSVDGITFAGMVAGNGLRYGYLRTDGSDSVLKVEVGDSVGGGRYSVARIDEHAIVLTDGSNREYRVKEVRDAKSSMFVSQTKPAPISAAAPALQPARLDAKPSRKTRDATLLNDDDLDAMDRSDVPQNNIGNNYSNNSTRAAARQRNRSSSSGSYVTSSYSTFVIQIFRPIFLQNSTRRSGITMPPITRTTPKH